MKAADLSEARILALLNERPGVWHTYKPEGYESIMPSVYDPGHPDAPRKVLIAKLRSMLKRGLLRGCACGCRGDWRVETA
jgi:hypothetical protein